MKNNKDKEQINDLAKDDKKFRESAPHKNKMPPYKRDRKRIVYDKFEEEAEDEDE